MDIWTFWCTCFILLLPIDCNKLLPQFVHCIFLGYSFQHKGCWYYDHFAHQHCISLHVTFLKVVPFFACKLFFIYWPWYYLPWHSRSFCPYCSFWVFLLSLLGSFPPLSGALTRIIFTYFILQDIFPHMRHIFHLLTLLSLRSILVSILLLIHLLFHWFHHMHLPLCSSLLLLKMSILL